MPQLNSFSSLSERAARALPTRNLINEWEIRALCQAACDERLRYLEGAERESIERWAMGAARRHLIRTLPVEKVSASFEGAPEWVGKALAAGQTVERARLTGEAHAELGHVLDWLLANPQRQLSKLSWEQAAKKTAAWDASREKALALQEDPDGIKAFCEAPSMGFGWRWVEVSSKASLAREGALMRHCVGSYAPQVESGKCRIFSLRDANNKPRLTVEVAAKDGGAQELLQIRGTGNRPPQTEEAPALRELIKELASGARLIGGRELSASGGLWDEAAQQFLLLCELPAGGSYPSARVSLGRRSGRLADDLTFEEVALKEAPEDGLPKRIKTKRALISGAGAYDLRGWIGESLTLASKEPVALLWADGFERVKCESVGRSWGYGAIRHGELRALNACSVDIAGRFERVEIESEKLAMEQASAREALWRARISKGAGPEGEALVKLFDCSFERLIVDGSGMRARALLESVSAQSVGMMGARTRVTHVGGDYVVAEAGGGVRQLALGSSGVESSEGMEASERADLEMTLREGAVRMMEDGESQEQSMWIDRAPEASANGVLRMLRNSHVSPGDRFCAELGVSCPAPLMTQGSGVGVVIDYKLFSKVAQSVASEATQVSRLAQRLSLKGLHDVSEADRRSMLSREPLSQLNAFKGYLGRQFLSLSLAEALAPALRIPEGLRALGFKNHRYVDESGQAREMPLAAISMGLIAQLMPGEENAEAMANEKDLQVRYCALTNPRGRPQGEPFKLPKELEEEVKAWLKECLMGSFAQSESGMKEFLNNLEAERNSASEELVEGGEALMTMAVIKDARGEIKPPRSLIEIKMELVNAAFVFHRLGQAADSPQLARESFEQWMKESSEEGLGWFVKDEEALKRAAGMLLPDACFGPEPVRTLMEGAQKSFEKERLPDWGLEVLQDYTREPSAQELVALGRAVEQSARQAEPGPLKSLLMAVAERGLALKQSAVARAAPESLSELEKVLYESALLGWEWAEAEAGSAAERFAQAWGEASAGAAEADAGDEQSALGQACARACLYAASSPECARVYIKALTQAALDRDLMPGSPHGPTGSHVQLGMEARKKVLGLISRSEFFTEEARKNLINAVVECAVARPAGWEEPGERAQIAGPAR